MMACPGAAHTRSAALGGRRVPRDVFLAAEGRVVAQHIGQLHAGQLERGIAAARRGRL